MSLKRNASGEYILRFWTRGHRPGSRLIYENLGEVTREDALRRKTMLEAKYCSRRTASNPALTFAELVDMYMEMEGARLSERGLQLLETTVRCHLKPYFGAMRVEDMRGLDVDRYRLQRRQLKRVKNVLKGEKEPPRIPTDRTAAPSTLNREWSLLRAILNWGESKELIERNPIRRRAVKMLDAKPRDAFFEPAEWRAFLEAAETDAELVRLVPVLRMALLTGSRPGEVLDIRWRDVDLERSTLTIRQKKIKGALKLLWIGPALEELLKAQGRGIGDAPVFPGPEPQEAGQERQPLGLAYYQTAFDRIRRIAKLETGEHGRLIPYTTRHTAATWMKRAGVSLDAIADVLGHIAPGRKTTLGYIHADAGHTKPALEVLAAAELAARTAALRGERNGNETAAPVAQVGAATAGIQKA